MTISPKIFIPALMAFALAACGGSSSSNSGGESANYTGKTAPADFSQLDDVQKTQVAETSAQVIYEAVNFSDTEEFMPFGISATETTVQPSASTERKLLKITQQQISKIQQRNLLANLPSGIKESWTEDCDSGSETWSIDFNENTGNGTLKATYKNCKYEYWDDEWDLTNGSISIRISQSSGKTTIKIEFSNFEATDFWDGETYHSKFSGTYEIVYSGAFDLDDDVDFENLEYTAKWDLKGTENGKAVAAKGSMSCSNSNCTFTTDIKAQDGKTYRVADLKTSTNSWGDIESVEGTLYHPDHGQYKFEAQIDWLCDGGDASIIEGKITYTDEQGNKFTYESTNCYSEPTIQVN